MSRARRKRVWLAGGLVAVGLGGLLAWANLWPDLSRPPTERPL